MKEEQLNFKQTSQKQQWEPKQNNICEVMREKNRAPRVYH